MYFDFIIEEALEMFLGGLIFGLGAIFAMLSVNEIVNFIKSQRKKKLEKRLSEVQNGAKSNNA